VGGGGEDGGGGGGFRNFFFKGGAPFARDREIPRVCYGPPVSLQVSGAGAKLGGPNGRGKKELVI